MAIKPDCLTKDSIIEINKQFENGTLRDERSLDFTIYKVSRTQGVNRKAATLLIEIVTKHPFIDGNKRTAIESMKALLAMHGKEITTKDNTLFDMISRITSQRYTTDETTTWIANHTK
ncbi:MAG: type II toxin-antitoxin system death-on-curing family toxin [Candidatus Altiarchaeota archaeon]|nr:type II toxin-antitoxin system death-on-curing family toxin [Candidatus Altiarchaeota archaeon]